MKGIWRVVVADLWWFLSGLRGILLLVALPAAVLLLVGNLRSRVEEYRIGIAGRANPPGSAQLDEATQLWEQLSGVRIVKFETPAVHPLSTLREQHLDLLLNVGDGGTTLWRMYSAETNPSRAAAVRQVATSLERSLLLIAARRNEGSAVLHASSSTPSAAREGDAQVTPEMVGFQVLPPSMLSMVYPAAVNRRITMLPMTIAFVMCFLPFVFAVSSLIRAREGHTLEIQLSAPGVDGSRLFAARVLLPTALTTFLFVMMVVQVDTFFGLHTKAAMGIMLLETLPAVLVASLLGVAASALVASQTQAVMVSALYFAALMLLTGFITPLTGAAPFVVAISRMLPLTFVMPALNAWFFGAGAHLDGAAWIALQLAASLALALVAFRRFLRRL